MEKRYTVQLVESRPNMLSTSQECARVVEEALNDEAHRNHGLQGIFSLTNGYTLVVWRTAT